MYLLQMYKLTMLPEGNTLQAVARAESPELLVSLLEQEISKPYLSVLRRDQLSEKYQQDVPALIEEVEIIRFFKPGKLEDYYLPWFSAEGCASSTIVHIPSEEEFVRNILEEIRFKVKQEHHQIENNTILVTN